MADPVKRLHYFDHQFLRANDFSDEQSYHIRMRRLHNQLLHVWGVAQGLDLAAPAGSARVTVRGGAAIDGLGRELVLPVDTQTVDLSGFASRSVFVTIRYDEQASDPTTETGAEGTTRSTEMPIVEVSPTPPADASLQLILGQAVIGADGKIASTNAGTDPNRRRSAGVVGGDLSVGSLTIGDASISTDRWAHLRLGAPNRIDSDSALRIAGNLGVGTDPSTLAADFGGPGRIRVRQGAAGTAGVWFNEGAKGDRAFVGMADDNNVGFFGSAASWGLVMNADTGLVGIGTATPSTSLHIGNVTSYTRDARITMAAGSGGGPARTWSIGVKYGAAVTSSPNYGLTIRDESAGAERMVIDWTTGNVGIGMTNPIANLDLAGILHVSGSTNPTTPSQGAYLGWNALTGGTGETDFINNQGGGSGGFAFMNTPPAGSPRTNLMVITGGGNVGIGTTTPSAGLQIANAGPQWSSDNLGSNLILDNAATARHTAIGIFDAFNSNPWAIANTAGVLKIAQMPPLGDSTHPPTYRVAIDANGLDVGGLLHVSGSPNPTTQTQGAYLGWNALTGGTGETDFINNQGGGSGGFAFMNTPPSGSPRTNLMVIAGGGNVGIANSDPSTSLHIGNTTSYPRDARITMAAASGAGPARAWSIGVKYGAAITSSPNYGLTICDESAGGAERMVIDWNTGNVGIGMHSPSRILHVEGNEIHSGGSGGGFSFANRDGGGPFIEDGSAFRRWVWYSSGGIARLWTAGRDVFSIDGVGAIHAIGPKGGYVADQFVNTLDDTLEEGDVVVLGPNQTSLYYGHDNGIPIPEVDLTTKAMDTRVCGIVCSVRGTVEAAGDGGTGKTSRLFTAEELTAMDAKKVAAGQVGYMVTLGAYAHCKVDADIAPIEVGDLLATSPTQGHAQKATSGGKGVGAILGKALGSLASGKGKIPILVTLH